RILTSLADKHPHHVRTVESEGFACQQRQPVTAVDPREFDPAVYAPLVEQLEREGIAIRTLESFEREGVEWLRPFYEMHCEIIQDVPMPEAFQPIPFDMFAKEVQDPKRYTLESKFVAVDGGRMVGVSELQANKADATVGHTMLTGVRRTHRRRKIATALKAAALGWAKSKGMRYVMTDNEEKNPMLDLNKQLGFRERYAFLQYAKDVD
ncbi:MAG TPA: GNAT family N-acetyltransferase, partial [Fimbriimonas sp.]